MKDTKFVDGAEKLKRRIATITASLALPAMMNEIGELLLRRTLRRFDAEVDPDNQKWKPLASETLQRRKRSGGYEGKKILVQTGEMRKAIDIIRGGAGSVYTNTGAGVRIGIQDEEIAVRGRVHNSGLGGIPQRRFLGIGKTDIGSVDQFLRRRADAMERKL